MLDVRGQTVKAGKINLYEHDSDQTVECILIELSIQLNLS